MNDDTKKANYFIIAVCIGILIILITGTYPFVIKCIYPNLSDRGLFGDSFGALNTLFSGLAFSGLIITILLQKQELNYQRIELQETRKVFDSQLQVMKIQNFDNSFQFLLNNQRETINRIEEIPGVHSKGGLYGFFEHYGKSINNSIFKKIGSWDIDLDDVLVEVFTKQLKPFESFLENYFVLDDVIKNLDTENKSIYYKTLNASIPFSYKVILLYYFYWKRAELNWNEHIGVGIIIDINNDTIRFIHPNYKATLTNFYG